jgi:hypothetical protein
VARQGPARQDKAQGGKGPVCAHDGRPEPAAEAQVGPGIHHSARRKPNNKKPPRAISSLSSRSCCCCSRQSGEQTHVAPGGAGSADRQCRERSKCVAGCACFGAEGKRAAATMTRGWELELTHSFEATCQQLSRQQSRCMRGNRRILGLFLRRLDADLSGTDKKKP